MAKKKQINLEVKTDLSDIKELNKIIKELPKSSPKTTGGGGISLNLVEKAAGKASGIISTIRDNFNKKDEQDKAIEEYSKATEYLNKSTEENTEIVKNNNIALQDNLKISTKRLEINKSQIKLNDLYLSTNNPKELETRLNDFKEAQDRLRGEHEQQTADFEKAYENAKKKIESNTKSFADLGQEFLEVNGGGTIPSGIYNMISGNETMDQLNAKKKLDSNKLIEKQEKETFELAVKIRTDREKKEYEARLAREKEYQRQRKAIQDEIQNKIAETDQLEEKNHFEQIKRNQAVATSIEEVTTSYDAEIDIVKQKSKEQVDAEAKKYDDLIAKADKYNLDTTQLKQDKADRITVIEQTAARDTLSIETEKQAKIKAINDKAEADTKAAAQRVMLEKQAVIELEKNLLDNYYSEIKSLQENADVKGAGGIIDVDATRANLDKVGVSLEIYLEKLKNFKDKQIAYIGEAMANSEEGSVEHTKLLQQKAQVEQEYANKVNVVNKAIADNTKKTTNTTKEYWKAVAAKIQEHVEHIMTGVSAVFSAIKESIKSQLEEANEHLTAISEKYNAVVEQRKASNDRINALQEEAKNARGGYGMVLQEQINQEMAKNQELAQQEAQLAKEKEKAEKEKEKKEKQMKKAELSQNIIQGISNVALSITKALAAGPFIGQIMAGVAAAAGAVQVGILTKQLAKLEDGGLLRGKRHAQGGMRIEGTNIEVEGGEYVVNRESTNKNLGLVRYINSQRKALTSADLNDYFSKSAQGYETPLRRRFEAGGTLPIISNGSNMDNELLVDAIRSIKFAPKVAVTDIIRAQDEMAQVDGWTGM